MPMSRLAAGTPDISLPSTSTTPESAVSKPARMRSAVVLPQPDGPSSATSSPGAMSRVSASSARTVPKDRLTRSSRTGAPPLAAWPADVFCVINSPQVLPDGPADGEQLDLATTGAAGPPAGQRDDQEQEQPGDEQGQQRSGGRHRAAG